MRPRSTISDLPSTHDVKVHLHNEFVKHIKSLKAAITISKLQWQIDLNVLDLHGKVSITQDGWSAYTTKQGFQGMTAHCIDVTEGKWKMKAAVIGFKAVSGAHTGENLGRYSVGLLDRVGIMDEKSSKACRFYRIT